MHDYTYQIRQEGADRITRDDWLEFAAELADAGRFGASAEALSTLVSLAQKPNAE